jgi:hypothetical protein
MQLNLYFSSETEEKLGAWCKNCNLKAYFDGEELVTMKQYS